MKTFRNYIIIVLTISCQLLIGQASDPFIDDFNARNRYFPEKAKEYTDIAGSPYLNTEFVYGVFYLKNSKTGELAVRYNIYADEMEYQIEGINYAIGNPSSLDKIIIDESVYVYLPFIAKGGYFELFESGKCSLVQKKIVDIKPADAPKPIVPAEPTKFVRKSDVFYFVVHDSLFFKIDNLKSVENALEDQKPVIKSFIKQEKIKKVKKENLIKIAKFYNGL